MDFAWIVYSLNSLWLLDMSVKFPRTCVSIIAGICLFLSFQAMAGPLGTSQADAAYSAKQILLAGGSADGNYWIDPNGGSTGDAFMVYADQSTAGGGWMLGLHSLDADPSATTDMVSNTGTVGLSTSQTRDMSEYAVGKSAEIRHVLANLQGTVIFDGFYTGDYHGNFANTLDWTVLTGDANIFSYHAGLDWSTATNDVDDFSGNCATYSGGDYPWYYGGCWTIMPANTGSWAAAPTASSAGGNLGSYSIYVRESSTPELEVSEPATIAMFCIGLAGLGFARRKPAA